MKRNEAIVVGWMALPVLLAGLSMAGFALGVPIGRWHAPVSLAMALGLTGFIAKDNKVRTVFQALAGVLASIALAGAFILYTNADAEVYHRPAAVLLANGWNPLRVTEVAQLNGMMDGGFSAWHVAFLPRMGWVFGAAFYKWFGFIEVADTINILMLLASLLTVKDWLTKQNIDSWLWTLLICISPVVAAGLWGGSVDAAWYSALLVAVLSAGERKWLPLSLGVLVMSGLKFTGVVVGAMIFAYGGIVVLTCRDTMREKTEAAFKLTIVGLTVIAAILLTNASPYLTSLRNHGGPFYPSHSFDKSERFEDAKNPITFDFGLMNDDARELGYLGRLTWAYGSQGLCKAYYRRKLNNPDFNPDFKVSGGVGGFGAIFRVAFWLSLLAWPFIRNRQINLMMALVLLTVLIQPTYYSGYARYVPQFYLFPMLAMLGIKGRFRPARALDCGLKAIGCGYAMALLAYPLSFFALQWIISVQNLQIVLATQNADGVTVVSNRLALRHSFANDFGCRGIRILSEKPAEALQYDSSYFGYYQCSVPGGINGLYQLRHQVSGNNADIKASRNAHMVRFFLKEFLPVESVRIPLRIWQTARLRLSQVKL